MQATFLFVAGTKTGSFEERRKGGRGKNQNPERAKSIRMSPKGRHAKSKARISAYEELLGKNQEKESGTREILSLPVRGWVIW